MHKISETINAKICAAGCERKNWNAENMYKKNVGHLGDVNLFSLKFNMPDHILEDVSRIRDLSYLNEQFNSTIKKFIKMTSMRKGTLIEEAVRVMNTTVTGPEHIAARHLRVKDACWVGMGQEKSGDATDYHMSFIITQRRDSGIAIADINTEIVQKNME